MNEFDVSKKLHINVCMLSLVTLFSIKFESGTKSVFKLIDNGEKRNDKTIMFLLHCVYF